MADATLQMVISQLRDNKASNDSKLDVVSQSVMRMNDALNGLLESNRQDRMDQLERDRETRRQANKATTQQNTGPPGKGLGLGGSISDLLGNTLKAVGFGAAGLALGKLAFKGLKFGAIGLALNFATQEILDYAFENFSLFDNMDSSDKTLIKSGASLGLGLALTTKLFGGGMKSVLAVGLAGFIAPWAIDTIKKYFDPDGDGKFKFELPDWTGMPDIDVDLNDPKHSGILTGLVTVAGALVFSMIPSVLKLFAIRLPVIAATWAASKIGQAYLNRSMKLAGVEADLRAQLDRMAQAPSSRRVSGSQGGALDAGGRTRYGQIPDGFDPYRMAPEGHVQARSGRFYRIDSPQGRVITNAATRQGIQGPGVNRSTGKVSKVAMVKGILGSLGRALVIPGIVYEIVLAMTDSEKRELGNSFESRFVTGTLEGFAGLADLLVNTGVWSINKLAQLVSGNTLIGDGSFRQTNMSGALRNFFLGYSEKRLAMSQQLYDIGGPHSYHTKQFENRLAYLKLVADAAFSMEKLDPIIARDKRLAIARMLSDGNNLAYDPEARFYRGPAMPGFDLYQNVGNTTTTNNNVIDFVAPSNDRDHLENIQ